MPSNIKEKFGWTEYNITQPQDKGIQVGNQPGRVEVGTPDLPTSLKDAISRNAGLPDAIKELPLISVDTLVLWASQRGKPISSSTAEMFLNKREDAGDLIRQTDDRGQAYWVRSPAFNKAHPISKILRDTKASVEAYREQGYTD